MIIEMWCKISLIFQRMIISWGAQIEVPPQVLLICEIILKLHLASNPHNRAFSIWIPHGQGCQYQFASRRIRQCWNRTSRESIHEEKPLSFHSRAEISSAGNSWRADRDRLALILIDVDLAVMYAVGPRRTRALAHSQRRALCAWHAPSTLCGPYEREIKWNHGATLSRSPPRSRSRLHANLSTQFQIRSWYIRQGE